MKHSALVITTPEGVSFSYELATPASRAFAWLLDAFILLAASIALSRLTGALGIVSADWAAAAGAIGWFVFSIAYGIACEWRWRGQTVGKRLFGLRVIDAHGLRLRLSQIVLRNLMRLFDSLPLLYLVGGTSALLSSHMQRLGDLVANTVVVRERRWLVPDIEGIAPARYNSLAAWPHLAARLRSAASPQVVAAAVRALTHRDDYDPTARVELFAALAAYFRDLAPYPPAVLESLSDEEYVRSVLRVIYAASPGRPALLK